MTWRQLKETLDRFTEEDLEKPALFAEPYDNFYIHDVYLGTASGDFEDQDGTKIVQGQWYLY